MNKKQLLSIVVPVFNEIESIDAFYECMLETIDSLESISYELIFVDDGSEDGSDQKLVHFAKINSNVRVIKLSRNFGHQIAITAGIDKSKGDAVVVIDADLQDPPEVIKEFIEKWEEGYDVVYGTREKREGESKIKLITATLFYRLLKAIAGIDIPLDVGDFRLMSKRAANHFRELKERDRFIRGLVSWIGYKQIGVPYMRDKRYAGETKYPYKKMIKFALDGITSFSSFPLKLSSWFGFIISFFAFLYSCFIIILKFMGFTIPGLATVIVGMLFLGGVQLICLGIIGEYIGRIFTEIKQRPMYVIEEMYDFKKAGIIDDNFLNKPKSNANGK